MKKMTFVNLEKSCRADKKETEAIITIDCENESEAIESRV